LTFSRWPLQLKPDPLVGESIVGEPVYMSHEVELRRVDHAERPVFDPLVDEYLAELSGHREFPVGPADAASYEYLPLYWEEPGRHPFWILASGTRVGFVLIREVEEESLAEEESIVEMSDFYIGPAFRRSGLGRVTLSEVWRRFPGSWRLQVHLRNKAGLAFWPRCIEEHACADLRVREVSEEDGRRLEYQFEIAAA
jgi:predicted acetyltransferase